MAEPKPHLLTRGELRRVEDCLNENSMLANCWKSEKVVIVACEPTGAHLSNKPFIDLDILSPAADPFPGSKTSERHPTRQICKKTIRILEKPKPKQSKRFGPRPWHSTYYFREQFSLYPDDIEPEP